MSRPKKQPLTMSVNESFYQIKKLPPESVTYEIKRGEFFMTVEVFKNGKRIITPKNNDAEEGFVFIKSKPEIVKEIGAMITMAGLLEYK